MKDEPTIVDLAFAIERFAAELERLAAQRGYPFVEVRGTAKSLHVVVSSGGGTQIVLDTALPVRPSHILDWITRLAAPVEQAAAWHATPLAQLRAAQRQAHGVDEQ